MNPVHRSLEPLLALPSISGIRVGFLSEDTPNRSYLYSWCPSRHLQQFLYQIIKHCDIALQASLIKDVDVFLIFEHKSHYALALYLVLVFKNKPVLLLVHGLQQLHAKSLFHYSGFNTLRFLVRYCKFYPVHLEKSDSCLPGSVSFKTEHKLTIPHPHPLAEMKQPFSGDKWYSSRLRVGVVGMFRADKPTQKLIELLVEMHKSNPSFDLVVGTPFWQKPGWLDFLDVEVIDTVEENNYNKLLSGIHVSIQDFKRDQYYFRPSGTINDAAMNECYVICPKFPVFEAQISIPVAVGSSFESLDDLPRLVAKVLVQLKFAKPDFKSWRSYRSMNHIAPAIRNFVLSVA
jgi:hypothetical protein